MIPTRLELQTVYASSEHRAPLALITICYWSPIHVFCAGVNPDSAPKAQWDSRRADTSILIKFGRPVSVKLSRSKEADDVSDSGVVNVDAELSDLFWVMMIVTERKWKSQVLRRQVVLPHASK